MSKFFVPALLVVVALSARTASAADDPKALAKRAGEILQQHCRRCHDGPGSASGKSFDVRKPKTLLQPNKKGKSLVVAGKADASLLWKKVENDSMPEDDPKVPAADKLVLKKWIDANLPEFDVRTARTFISLETVYTTVRDDLKKTDKDRRAYRRYFMLTHLHNNNSIPDDQLAVVRAALSKAINSVSWGPDVTAPVAIDKEKTVFAIDIQKLDWDRNNLWNEVLKEYPYGLRFDRHPDSKVLRELDEEIYEYTGSPQPILHADWFIATATRPPLYHALMFDAYLPALRERHRDPEAAAKGNPKRMTAYDLEEFLGVNVLENFLSPDPDRIARGGFGKSGVSGQNRLVERHRAKHGYYWISYDFKPDSKRIKLTRFPLGPLNLFEPGKHPYPRQAFVQDGGEVIYSLPNGLQGYLLLDGKGNRIDEGPIQVVNDPARTSGTPAIVTGVSCMSCHAQGVISFTDEIRTGHTLLGFNDAARHVEQLYPEKEVMDRLLARDAKRFTRAAEEATDEFLKDVPDREKLAEPIGIVSRRYRLEFLDIDAVACDLFEPEPKNLKIKLGGERFRRLGLNVLTKEGGVISRLEWENVDGLSLMQEVAQSYGGSPVVPAK